MAGGCESGGMNAAESSPDRPIDPKEQMKAALEAKKAAQHAGASGGGSPHAKASGGPHGPQGEKRQFRRKAGS